MNRNEKDRILLSSFRAVVVWWSVVVEKKTKRQPRERENAK